MNSAIRSLVLAAGQHGVELSKDSLMHEYTLSDDNETEVSKLIRIATENGLKAHSIQTEWSEIAKLGSALPVIAKLSNGRCVVVARWNSDGEGGETLSVLDPAAARPKVEKISKEKFVSAWSGELLLVQRHIKLMDDDQPFSRQWIVKEFLKQKTMMIQVVGIAFLLHIFGFLPIIYIMTVLDKVVNYEAYSTLVVIAVGISVAHLFNGMFSYLKSYIALFFTAKMEVKLNSKAFNSLMDQSVDYFQKTEPSKVVQIVQQVGTIKQFLIGKMFGTMLDATALFFFIPILIMFSPTLFVIVLVFAILIAINNIMSASRLKEAMQKVGASETQKQSILMNSISGIETVKSLTLESVMKKSWEEHSTSSTLASMELGKMAARSAQVSATLQQLMTIVVIFVGVLLVFSDGLSPGVLIGVNMLAGKVTGPLVQLASMSTEIEKFNTAVDLLGGILNKKGERKRRGSVSQIKGGIKFSDVTFSYKDSDPVISNVSFTIPARQTVGLVGPSGCGKSTLLRIIQGLIKPQEGNIYIDGIDMRTIDMRHLRVNTSLVGNDNTFFTETIRENILRPMPTASMERVIWASKMVALHDTVEDMPDGYETKLEEKGANLSEGQRKKIALARALIRNPKIIMMDEALSGLGLDDEISIRNNMPEIRNGRTMLVVTHHLSQIIDSDLILVMNSDGELAEQGKHQELIAKGGVYADLWKKELMLRGSKEVTA
ncbi:MAG: peptidase domain-containing ABC transporter [Thiotrichales bacterium]|jgi:ATP-binding cassette subfamily B protein|nr:peptidase domain-containing ABC transporter [Thiotrichales bacterium]